MLYTSMSLECTSKIETTNTRDEFHPNGIRLNNISVWILYASEVVTFPSIKHITKHQEGNVHSFQEKVKVEVNL